MGGGNHAGPGGADRWRPRQGQPPAVDLCGIVRAVVAHRAGAAGALRAGRTRRDLGPQHSRMDHGRVRRRHGGRPSGDRQTRLPVARGRICFESGDIAKPALPKVRSTDPVMIQYTSGTTGFPKGALLHHRGLVNNGAHTADRAGIPDGAIQVTTMPLFHTGGCVCCVLGAISRRATQVLLEAFDPGLVIELIETYHCNAMLGVPTMLVAMMEHPSFATADLSSMKAIYSGGSTVPASIVPALEQRLGAAFTIVFGQTECSPVALMTWATDTITDKAETIGSPMPNVEVKIVHPDSGKTAL